MKLKKLHKDLQYAIDENNEQPSELLVESFSIIKSGSHVVAFSQSDEKLVQLLAFAIIQRVKPEIIDYPQVLLIVQDKEQALKIKEYITHLSTTQKLEVFITFDQADLDEDKMRIAEGIHVLIGTPERINILFSRAGFDGNRLKIFAIHQTDELLRKRHQVTLARLSESIGKCQHLCTINKHTEQLEKFIEKTMINEFWFFDKE